MGLFHGCKSKIIYYNLFSKKRDFVFKTFMLFITSVLQRLSVFILIYSLLSLIRILFYFDYYKNDLLDIFILFVASILMLLALPIIQKNLERNTNGD